MVLGAQLLEPLSWAWLGFLGWSGNFLLVRRSFAVPFSRPARWLSLVGVSVCLTSADLKASLPCCMFPDAVPVVCGCIRWILIDW